MFTQNVRSKSPYSLLDGHKGKKYVVLVYSKLGISRSVTACIAYYMRTRSCALKVRTTDTFLCTVLVSMSDLMHFRRARRDSCEHEISDCVLSIIMYLMWLYLVAYTKLSTSVLTRWICLGARGDEIFLLQVSVRVFCVMTRWVWRHCFRTPTTTCWRAAPTHDPIAASSDNWRSSNTIFSARTWPTSRIQTSSARRQRSRRV